MSGAGWQAGTAAIRSSTMRVHIVGASGSGTSTLGAALAQRLGSVHLDTDDYFWEQTDPPYQTPRPVEERQSLLSRELSTHESWVLAGSLCGWGDRFIPLFEYVVFLRVPTETRLARLRHREAARFGEAALAPGGTMHANHRDFLAWAACYDDGDLTVRSLVRHDEWLRQLPCPVLRCEGEMALEDQVKWVLDSVECVRSWHNLLTADSTRSDVV